MLGDYLSGTPSERGIMYYSTGVAYLLWLACIFGFCGIRCFYAGKPITRFLWLFTLGRLGFG